MIELWSLYIAGGIISAGFMFGLLAIEEHRESNINNFGAIVAVLCILFVALLLSWVGVVALIIMAYAFQKRKDATGWDK